MTTIIPPTFIERYQYKSSKQINDSKTGKRLYETPQNEKLPSVTTILGATKDMTHLDAWKQRVGHDNAKAIVTEAANVGTEMHANLERFIVGLPRQTNHNVIHNQANKMADVIIANGLSHVSEIWAMEQSLYYPGLYAGTTDLIGVYDGIPAIMDYKQSNKPKRKEWIEDYFLQLVAYAMAHNEVYNTNIQHGHIFVCTRDLEFQQFDLVPEEFNMYQDIWLTRIDTFYKNTI